MTAGSMIVHRSNRIEALVDALADLVARPLPDPLAREWIAVQGRGMERWLALELARRLGVWANPAFPFPRKVIEAATASVLGTAVPASAAFDPHTLRWAVAEALPRHLERPAFAPIRAYLDDDPRGARCLQLAIRIADLFDQYALYRPHMVLGWEAGVGADWQAELWRALVRSHGALHAAAHARAVLAALADGRVPGPDFPRRLSLFGISTLPPLYVQVLAALAQSVELHLFLLSPSREYWGDLRSRRTALRERARLDAPLPRSARDGEPAAGIEGHPLLASLGRVGREFQQVLEELVDYQDGVQCYVDAPADSVLTALQSDILTLRVRAGADRIALRADDDSIAVHACHSPMREVEVLHDQLVALFERDPTLTPADVVVMTPAIDAYAPLVEAVFGSGGRPHIPYRVADRRTRAQHEVLDAFLHALELTRGRLPAPDVLDLLGLESVRARFDIAAEELERLRRWVAQSGIRWGADAGHRAELGQPACADNTWRFGLDRLLLGYALPGEETRLFGGVLPYDDVEGADAALLGRFAEYCDTLCRWRAALAAPRHPAAWREPLAALLAALVASTPATAYQHEAIGAALEELAAGASAGGFTGTVDLAGMHDLLERELERPGSPRGFLTGAVTVCELVPMRTIPFRVVCLLGLDDGKFPRARRPLGFDLMAAHPQAGDRTARDDDRYLFLEALLAARQHLIVTYVGQSVSDNSELPPSVVVNELLDAIDATCRTAGPPRPSADGAAPSRTWAGACGRPRQRIVQRHALQPFSPRYFGRDPDPRAFSYAATHYAGALALVGERQAAPPLLSAPLPAPPTTRVALDDLVRFFAHPARWFLQQRLGVYLGRDAELLDEREPLELDHLERWKIGDALLRHAVRGGDVEAAWAALRASGALPLGAPGRCAFDDVAPQAAALAAAAAQTRGGERLPPEAFELDIDGVRLSGVLRDLWPGGQVVVQYSKLGGYRELELWIRHLARAAASGSAAPSVLFGRQDKGDAAAVWLAAPPQPQRLLATLLGLFAAGQHAPLPFLRYASRAFAETLLGPKGTLERAWSKARDKFGSADRAVSDAADAYVAELYPGGPPFGAGVGDYAAAFADTAQTVFEPFFHHRELR